MDAGRVKMAQPKTSMPLWKPCEHCVFAGMLEVSKGEKI
jgi:hypothetical protein